MRLKPDVDDPRCGLKHTRGSARATRFPSLYQSDRSSTGSSESTRPHAGRRLFHNRRKQNADDVRLDVHLWQEAQTAKRGPPIPSDATTRPIRGHSDFETPLPCRIHVPAELGRPRHASGASKRCSGPPKLRSVPWSPAILTPELRFEPNLVHCFDWS